jgi:hypothetical protein
MFKQTVHRALMFTEFQATDSTSLRPLCPTRWTMRISSIQSVLKNYNELISFLEDMSATEKGDAGYKAGGFAKQLQTFSMYFSLCMLNNVFSKSESASTMLQSPKLSLSNAKSCVDALSDLLTAQRNDDRFRELWLEISTDALNICIDQPVLPRTRKVPGRIDGNAPSHNDETAQDFYRRIYYSTVDTALGCLASRFRSPAFERVCNMESVVVDTINSPSGSSSSDAWQLMLNHLDDDTNGERLKLHLAMFGDLCRSAKPKSIKIRCVNDIVQCLKANEAWINMLPELTSFLRLFLTIPVTSCTAERSFSALRRLKTFLRSTVTQKRLNHVALLHIHREQSELIDLKYIYNNFIGQNQIRSAAFAPFE